MRAAISYKGRDAGLVGKSLPKDSYAVEFDSHESDFITIYNYKE